MATAPDPSPASDILDLNTKSKSPISLIYEIAIKRYTNVLFEVCEKGPPHMKVFVTMCRVGDLVAEGEGNGKKSSKKMAAAKMLEKLSKLPPLPANDMLDFNRESKSPISLVYEIAIKRNSNVLFEVVNEKGAPHLKVFVTMCRVGDLVTEGKGNKKKSSKKMAAEKMLEELSKLPPFSLMNDIAPQLKREQNHEKSGSEYGEDINPIARLNQIQQAGKEEVPTYTVIEERGTPQRRVVAEASANGIFCTGTGPNKKLEKRATTEVILERLGYSKSVIQPASTADALDNKARTKTSTANNKQPAPQGIRSKDQLEESYYTKK